MTSTSIFLCREARRAEWHFGRLPPAAGRLTLIGWTQEPNPIDTGVPSEVAGLLARALTSAGRVSFPTSLVQASASGDWSKSGSDDIRGLALRVPGRVAAALKGMPGHVVLVSTMDPATVVQAFDDPGYPWWMQGQILLVSASTAAPPDIERSQLFALFEDEWAKTADTLAPLGIVGIVRPGVDGAVAGVLSLDAGFDDAVVAALEREAEQASFDWSVVREEAFALRCSG